MRVVEYCLSNEYKWKIHPVVCFIGYTDHVLRRFTLLSAFRMHISEYIYAVPQVYVQAKKGQAFKTHACKFIGAVKIMSI